MEFKGGVMARIRKARSAIARFGEELESERRRLDAEKRRASRF
jgi:hypothetical protein